MNMVLSLVENKSKNKMCRIKEKALRRVAVVQHQRYEEGEVKAVAGGGEEVGVGDMGEEKLIREKKDVKRMILMMRNMMKKILMQEAYAVKVMARRNKGE